MLQFKTKMQIQVIRAKSGSGAATGAIAYRNVFHAGYVIISSYGFRAAYQGVTGTLLRNIPANGIYFGTYSLNSGLSNFISSNTLGYMLPLFLSLFASHPSYDNKNIG